MGRTQRTPPPLKGKTTSARNKDTVALKSPPPARADDQDISTSEEEQVMETPPQQVEETPTEKLVEISPEKDPEESGSPTPNAINITAVGQPTSPNQKTPLQNPNLDHIWPRPTTNNKAAAIAHAVAAGISTMTTGAHANASEALGAVKKAGKKLTFRQPAYSTPAVEDSYAWDTAFEPSNRLSNAQVDYLRAAQEELRHQTSLLEEKDKLIRNLEKQIRRNDFLEQEARRPPELKLDPITHPIQPTMVPGAANARETIGETEEQKPLEGDFKRYRSKNPIETWRLQFDGNISTMSVESFLRRVEKFRITDGVTEDFVAQNLHKLLTGPAERWYWLREIECPSDDWSKWKQALLRHFRGPTSAAMDDRIISEIVNRKQRSRESFDDFYIAVLELNTRLQVRRSPEALIDTMRRNLLPRLSAAVLTTPFQSLEHFRDVCLMVETYQATIPPARDIHEISPGYYGTNEDYLEAFIKPQHRMRPTIKDSSKWLCWNCNQQGHGFRDCLQPVSGIFCFRCGHKGSRTPWCPVCHPENQQMPVKYAGNPRPPKALPAPNVDHPAPQNQ